MSVRSLSRPLGALAAAGALTLASGGAALAVPAPDCACGGARVAAQTSGNVTPGTDVAAPDQQNPIAAPVQPKLAAAPTWPVNPATLTPPVASSPSADDGFQWDDAGIGAGGALIVVLAGLGGALAFRRRTVADPPLAA
jgi:hypothetical protein